MKLPWRRGKHSLGQSMVEFALILPIFALFLVIAVDFGRIYFSYIQVTNAAREGAAFGAVSPTNDAGIQAAAEQETDAQGQSGENTLTVTTECKDSTGIVLADCSLASGGAGPGNTITVAVSEKFNFITPLVNAFFGNNFVMQKTATATVLGYAAGTGGGGGGGGGTTTCTPPIPSFSVVITTGLTIHVDPTASRPNSGVCTISGYNWSWGDSVEGVGTAYGDDYTYANAGTYTITLETTNQAGATSTTQTVTVPEGSVSTCAKPTAAFHLVSRVKQNGNNYLFTYKDDSTVADALNCPITAWAWSFDDGTLSNAQNPSHLFSDQKKHSATLIATNAGGSSTAVTHAYP